MSNTLSVNINSFRQPLAQEGRQQAQGGTPDQRTFDALFDSSVSQRPQDLDLTTKNDQKQREEDLKEITYGLRGARAAMLHAGLVGVEITNAAQVDLAGQNATELAARSDPSAALEAARQSGNIPVPKKLHLQRSAPGAANQQDGGASRTTPGVSGHRPNNPVTTTLGGGGGNAGSTSNANPDNQPVASNSSDQFGGGPTFTSGVHGITPNENLTTEQAGTASGAGSAFRAPPAAQPGGGGTPINPSIGPDGIRPLMSPAPDSAGAAKQASPTRPSTPSFNAQLQKGLAQLVKQEGGQITLRLTPKALGEVMVTLQIQDGKAEGVFQPTTQKAWELLNIHLDDLRQSLTERGIEVTRLVVEPPTENDGLMRGHSLQNGSTESNQPNQGEQLPDEARSQTDPDDTGRSPNDSDMPGQEPSPLDDDPPGDQGQAHMDDALTEEQTDPPRQHRRVTRYVRLDTLA